MVTHARATGRPATPSAMISTATVQDAHYTGRGPTKAKTLIGEDMVTVLLADTLTRGERTLVANGRPTGSSKCATTSRKR